MDGLGAGELKSGAAIDDDLVVGALDDADVHQLCELVDGLVALVLEHGRGIVVRTAGGQLLIDAGDLLQCLVGQYDVVGNAEISLAAQRLHAVGHAVELLRQRLRGAEQGGPCRRRIRARRQGLRRGGEIIEHRVERGGRPRLAEDPLQLIVKTRALGGEGAAGRFRPQLSLHELIEHTVDRIDANAVAGTGG
jgi:hypothetical protein